MKRLKIPEKAVQQSILDWCAINRIMAHRRNVGAVKTDNRFIRFNQAGMSDIWGIANFTHFECEVKREGGKLSPSQELWLDQVRLAGGVAFMADSLDSFIDQMRENGLI